MWTASSTSSSRSWAFFLLTEGLLVYFIVKYRAREGGRARHTHGNHALELTWTFIPGLILFALAVFHTGTWGMIKFKGRMPSDSDKNVEVVRGFARQFEWNFGYRGRDGKFGTPDDFVKREMYVPVGRPVIVKLQTRDVLHSFWLPNARLKQDLLPGRTINQWFEITKAGPYPVVCAELCGNSHTKMQAHQQGEQEGGRADLARWRDGCRPPPRPEAEAAGHARPDAQAETGCGKLYITINEDEHGLFEVFTPMGKSGGCTASQSEAIGRLISLALRSGIDPESIAKQLRGIRCPSPLWQPGGMVLSCSDAVAKALERFVKERDAIHERAEAGAAAAPEAAQPVASKLNYADKGDVCPECPECGTMVEYVEGCVVCRTWGFSKCW